MLLLFRFLFVFDVLSVVFLLLCYVVHVFVDIIVSFSEF